MRVGVEKGVEGGAVQKTERIAMVFVLAMSSDQSLVAGGATLLPAHRANVSKHKGPNAGSFFCSSRNDAA